MFREFLSFFSFPRDERVYIYIHTLVESHAQPLSLPFHYGNLFLMMINGNYEQLYLARIDNETSSSREWG